MIYPEMGIKQRPWFLSFLLSLPQTTKHPHKYTDMEAPTQPSVQSTALPNMEHELQDAMVESVESGKKFVPLDKVQEILTPTAVKREFEASLPQQPEKDIDDIVEQIFSTPPTRHRTFGVLLFIEQLEKMEDFVAEGLFDHDLPLSPCKGRRGFRKDRTCTHKKVIQSDWLRTWSKSSLESFETHQCIFIAPNFLYRPGGVDHYSIGPDFVLPFITAGNSDEAAGGSGDIRKVNIHLAHWCNLHPSQSENVNQSPTVHHQPITRTNLVSRRHIPHSLSNDFDSLKGKNFASNWKPSRGFPAQPTRSTWYGSCYHLGFWWADGTLLDYWKAHDHEPEPWKTTGLRFPNQVLGLVEGLSHIHVTHKPLPGVEVETMYGRNVDFKAQTILWFKPRRNPSVDNPDADVGNFCISGSGFASFYRSPSSTNTDARSVGCTLTYRPPECDIGDELVSQSFDTWSLGCLLLEFSTWYLSGWDSIWEFSRKQMGQVAWTKGSTFFALVTSHDSIWLLWSLRLSRLVSELP